MPIRIRFTAAMLIAAAISSSPGAAQAVAAGPPQLSYYCEDIPPSNYVERGALKGISVDLLRLMWARLGIGEQPIHVVPWTRGYEIADGLADKHAALLRQYGVGQ